jgi:predicted enzyme related to lactoylglutathione lyase
MNEHHKINYIEFASRDIAKTKKFFTRVFGWVFEDYGPDYAAFAGQGIDGGFYAAELESRVDSGGALVVFYSEDLNATLKKIEEAGGSVLRPIFSFPGGHRFHFSEPGGNELAVWSDTYCG